MEANIEESAGLNLFAHFGLGPNGTASPDGTDCVPALHLLALDALVAKIGLVGVIPINLNIGAQLMHPALAHVAFDPVLAIIGGLEVHLMAIYAITLAFVSFCTNGAQLIRPRFPLAVVVLRAVFIAAGCCGYCFCI